MGTVAQVASVLSSLASTGSSIYGMTQQANAPGVPKPTPVDPTAQARMILPAERANAAANAGGGFSPEFLANLIGDDSSPAGALGILGDIRRSLGPGQQGP